MDDNQKQIYESYNNLVESYYRSNPYTYYMFQGAKSVALYWSSVGIIMNHFMNPASRVFPY